MQNQHTKILNKGEFKLIFCIHTELCLPIAFKMLFKIIVFTLISALFLQINELFLRN